MNKLLIFTALTSASLALAGCNSAPKEEAPATTEAMAPEAAAPEAAAPDAAMADGAAADAAPAAEASDGSDDTETGGGSIKPLDSGN